MTSVQRMMRAVRIARPTGEFVLNGDTFDGLKWLGADPAPSSDEINKALKIVDGLSYQEQRAAAYPPIGDQLDAIWTWLSTNNVALPQDTAAMLAKIQAIKNQYPKG